MSEAQLKTDQRAFAAHIRDPDNNPAPADIEDRRMGIYRELFFNNMRSFLAGYFPIAAKLLGDEHWSALARQFYREHDSHEPLFTQLGHEFLEFLNSDGRRRHEFEPPYLAELMHYEWVEAALNLSPDETPDEHINTNGDPLQGIPVISELAWLLSYQWPVHQIGPGAEPAEPLAQPVHFLVYRNTDEKVVFVTLNAVSARLLQLLSDNTDNMTGEQALRRVADEMNHPDPDQVVVSGSKIISDWSARRVIVGTR